MSTTLSSTFHSFAYGLVRLYAPAELYAAPLRLLSAPEQDVVLQELLTDNPESVALARERCGRALGTRGFAREVHAVLSRARERGLDRRPARARSVAPSGLPEFEAAGLFLEQYLDVLDDQSAIDYPDLIAPRGDRGRGAPRRAARPVPPRLRRRVPGHRPQPGRAAPGARRRRPQPHRRGRPRPVHLRLPGRRGPRHPRLPGRVPARRRATRPTSSPSAPPAASGPRLLRASRGSPTGWRYRQHPRRRARRSARPTPAGRSATAGSWSARSTPSAPRPSTSPTCSAGNEFGPGSVDVLTFDTARAETEHVADLLRRAHLEDGIGWSEMAVLVRSGRSTIPPCAGRWPRPGCPSRSPATRPRWSASPPCCRCWTRSAWSRTPTSRTPPTTTSSAPTGPRRCSPRPSAASTRPTYAPSPARSGPRDRAAAAPATWSARAALDPALLAGLDGEPARRALAPRRAPRPAPARSSPTAPPSRRCCGCCGTAPTGGRRLRGSRPRAAARAPGSRTATSTRSARCSSRRPGPRSRRGTPACAAFLGTLRAQEIPADTLADRGVRGEAVRLLTAHRSKGLEWRLVVVAHVQEGAWPDLRRRDSLLQADRIGAARAAAAADPRRRCWPRSGGCSTSPATRARQRLSSPRCGRPTTTASSRRGSSQELGTDAGAPASADPRRARCRWPGWSPSCGAPSPTPTSPSRCALAAARRLQCSPPCDVHGRPVAPAADPATWWGTAGADPLRPPGAAHRRAAHDLGQRPRGPADLPGPVVPAARGRRERCVSQSSQGFGKVVHALAERVASGELEPTRRRDELMTHVDDGLGPDGVPHPLVPGPRARGGRGRAGPVPRLARSAPARGWCSRPSRRSAPR